MLERATSITMLLAISIGMGFNAATLRLAVINGEPGEGTKALMLMGLLIFFGWSFLRDPKEVQS